MQGKPKPELLAQDIAAAIESNYMQRPASRALLFAGIAFACLQPGHADALTLGELKVQSTIGQPLVSTTTARITAGETLSTGCVSSVAKPQGGLNSPNDLTVTIPETSVAGEYPVQITSAKPLYEPMYEIQLQVKCPGNVSLVRSYVVMLNMPMTSPQTQPVSDQVNNELQPVLQAKKAQQTLPQNNTPQITRQNQPAEAEVPGTTVPAEEASTSKPVTTETSLRSYTGRFTPPMEAITADVDYRVQEGDTLSTIAHRIQDRPANSTHEVAAIIHQRNPDAFVNNNPNLVKLGAVLSIPPIEELLGQDTVAMRPNPEVLTDKKISAPAVEQIIDKPVETTIKVSTNEITVSQELAKPELNKVTELAEPLTAAPEDTSLTKQDVQVEAALPAPVPALIANNAETSETEIVTERSLLENLPDQETIEPIAAAEVRKLDEYEAEITALENTDSGYEADESFSIHPLFAAGLGGLLAFIMAIMIFGKRLQARIFPNLSAQRNANALDALDIQAHADTAAADQEDSAKDYPEFSGDTDAVDEQPEQIAVSPATDIDTGTAADPAIDNVDLDISATANHPESSLDLDLSSLETAGEHGDVQQVDLMDIDGAFEEESPLEKTERFSGPEFSTEGVELDQMPSELDGTGTMRKLFSEEADKRKAEEASNNADFSVTEEMADLDETSDLQSLADNVGLNNPDDGLSKTLTRALGLLEQDYEDEYSGSQILEQREIETAFTEHEEKG